jgi:2-methylisocitrate lyase-like PEP mutase family enzyme
MAGKEVVERREWLTKLNAVVKMRPAIDLFVVARTDARSPKGLKEAIVRGRAARDLGVDAVFVEAPQSVAELDAIALGVPGPKVANMVEWGRTPLLSPKELHQRGFDLIVYPVAAILAQARAVEDVYGALRREGSTVSMMSRLCPFEDFNHLMGLERQRERERAAVPIVEVTRQAPPPGGRRRRSA